MSSSSSSSDDDDDGGEEDIAGASGATGGDDVDWDTIQEDEECWPFFFSSLFGALCQRGRKLEGSTTFSMPWRLLQLEVMFVSV